MLKNIIKFFINVKKCDYCGGIIRGNEPVSVDTKHLICHKCAYLKILLNESETNKQEKEYSVPDQL